MYLQGVEGVGASNLPAPTESDSRQGVPCLKSRICSLLDNNVNLSAYSSASPAGTHDVFLPRHILTFVTCEL